MKARVQKSFLGVVFMVIAVTISVPATVGAYGGLTHEWVIIQGFDLFKCPGPEPCACPKHYYPELEQPLTYNQVCPWWPSNNWFTNIMVNLGAEDSHDHNGWNYDITTGTHFWDGDSSDELVISSLLGGTIDYENAMDNARRLLKQARELYLNNQKGGEGGAYDLLAHVIHLIGDMTVPAHAHVIDHAVVGDSYDDWVNYPEEETNTFLCNHARWTSDHARAAGGPVAIPEGMQSVYTSIVQNNNDGLWPPVSPGADLYYLIYTANQYGDYFGCQGQTFGAGSDGDSDDRWGWVNYGAPPFSNLDDPPRTEDRLVDNSEMIECVISPTCPVCMMINPTCWLPVGSVNDDDGDLSKIASVNLPYAYRAAATMIKSFRDSIDNIPPVSETNLEGTAGHDGWFRSDVYMRLSSTDNSDSMIWAPNLTMSQWRFAATTGDCWFNYAGPHVFISEGIQQVRYRSIDGLGNEENPLSATVKIDKTPPVISITTPQSNGFYLTSGTLTIDFAVSDALSGVYSFSAKLDGTEVSDGQVFDLDNMGGWHTFTVEVEDYAGNRTFQSVEFSIKIHATVDFKPDQFNSKSEGVPVTVYIEFPAGYDVNLINVNETHLKYSGWWLPATAPTEVNDYDRDGVRDRMVKFGRQDFITALQGATGNISVIVDGQLVDGTEFYGTETVLVTNPPN